MPSSGDVRKEEKLPWAAEPRTGSPERDCLANESIAVNADSTRDPCAALVLHNWKFEQGERVNPKLPNFGEVLLGTDYHSIVNVSQHVDFERGEMGQGLDFGAEVVNGVF